MCRLSSSWLIERMRSSLTSASRAATSSLGGAGPTGTSYARPAAAPSASPPPAASSLDAAEIVVVGGGFGGLYTSLRLAALEWRDAPPPRVTLVDRSEHFTFLPMLYELVTGAAAAWEVSPRFSDLLASSSISFVHAEVTALDRHARLLSIQPRDGAARQLPFDACVLALGSEPAPPPVSGGALALPFYTREHALALRQTLQSRWPKPGAPPLRVVVVGGGYIGVELSANLARWGRSDRAEGSAALAVSLVHRSDSLLDASKPYSRKAAVSRLSRLGVHSVLDTSVEAMSEDAVALRPAAGGAEGYSLGADVVLWAAGSRPNRLLASLGLPLDSRGRVCTDRFLRVSSLDGTLVDGFYALGDAATCGEREDAVGGTPSTAQAAMQQADYVAWNLRASMLGDKLLPFRFQVDALPSLLCSRPTPFLHAAACQDLGEMISLGEDAASVSALGLVELDGPLAAVSRRAVYAARMPTASQAASVGASWAVDSAVQMLRNALKKAGAQKQSKP
mmetsp:Transcript_24785/g.59859  ORF Transcript_24785/g.59859 Transcript_24785/m.59859 type:complete len:508 (+) Transcript_24785:486-2009(+)